MSEESKFTASEIEQQRRQVTSRRTNVDYDLLQVKRDLLLAARTDTPEQFQARIINRGIDLASEQGRKVMKAYWAIRKLQR